MIVETRRHGSPADRFALVARTTRNGHSECWHLGAAAVATPEGRLAGRVGDPELPTFMRSAAKPLQALSLLVAGGWDAFALEPADLALICASHAGTPAHVERAQRLLDKGGFAVSDLLCGSHPPFDPPTAESLRRAGAEPGPLYNNCSGKHAGLLLLCRLRGWPTADYTALDHPLHQAMVREVEDFCGLEDGAVGLGIDGCSLPTFQVPLAGVARAYAKLADPALAGLSGARRQAVERIVGAMTGAPEMVAGPGRFTTRLIEATGGRVLGKEGAMGVYAAAVRGPVAMGLAVKIADGAEVCRDGVVLDLLRQLGALSAAEFEALAPFRRPPIRNHRGEQVGEVVPDVELAAPEDA